MNEKEFYNELDKLEINYDEKIKKKLEIYFKFLSEYNEHTNITSIINKEDVYLKHFYDSLTIVNVANLNKVTNLLDVGSGGGFPGIVLKIFFDNLMVTVLDSNNKKTNFLEKLVKKLELSNVKVINDRAENYIKNKREYYDIVTFRAVSNSYIASELGIPFLKIGGSLILYKGNELKDLDKGKKHAIKLGGCLKEVNEFTLPDSDINRSLVTIEKVSKTIKLYPRIYGTIKKNSI